MKGCWLTVMEILPLPAKTLAGIFGVLEEFEDEARTASENDL